MANRFFLRRHAAEKGQSLLEMTFGMVVLVFLLMGMLDLGRLYFTYVAMEDAAGEAALYVAARGKCASASPTPPDPSCDNPNNGRYRANGAAAGVVDLSTANSAVTFQSLGPFEEVGVGTIVVVTITYDFPLITPVMSTITGSDTILLTSQAKQFVISETSGP